MTDRHGDAPVASHQSAPLGQGGYRSSCTLEPVRFTTSTRLQEAAEMHDGMISLLQTEGAPAGRRAAVVLLLEATAQRLNTEREELDDELAAGVRCGEDLATVARRATLGVLCALFDEAVAHTTKRETFRKLRRDRYQLRNVLTELAAGDDLSAMDRLWQHLQYRLYATGNAGALDPLLQRFGIDEALLAAAQNLAATVAQRRGLEIWMWDSYALGIQDRALLAELGRDSAFRHRLDHAAPGWVHADTSMRRILLEATGWFDGLDRNARDTAMTLCGEWDGSLGSLWASARHI